MIVNEQKNIKVHFASTENVNQFNVVRAFGNKYFLYTAYPFIERMMFKKPKHQLIASQFKNDIWQIPQQIISAGRHTIQDSGLFTLMFGSQSGKKDEKFLDLYYEKLIEFTIKFGNGSSVVEMDTQKVLGVESAWKYREQMRSQITNRIINVFHIEDGEKGLDRLIEFSDYIAISVPELRFAGKKNYLVQICNYIKNRKPKIDIHLLGFTEKKLLNELRFCSSCDSSSYTSGVRYGFVNGNKISNIIHDKAKQLIAEKDYQFITKYISNAVADGLIVNVKHEMNKYLQNAGSQD